MSNVKVCVRFRPINSREKKLRGDSICFRRIDEESFVFKDEKDEEIPFCFDRVFYQETEQGDVYEFLARPIIEDALNGINGTLITYGQTGAGKTYSLEGPGIFDSDDHSKGLLPRVIDGLFECLESSADLTAYNVKLSMVEIYREKIRDLLDISKDNMQIREGKVQGIYLSGATETEMNIASSRSHCVYSFSVHGSVTTGRVRTGKLVLVDLAGSEKAEKTGAEGIVLEEAKTINKSLSALGNVINALTNGKVSHIPYRSSKLTRILQDALGGNSRTALLCCCSPSSSNVLESMSTLRFGTRAKLIKTLFRINFEVDKAVISPGSDIILEEENVIMEVDDKLLEEVCDENEPLKPDDKLPDEVTLDCLQLQQTLKEFLVEPTRICEIPKAETEVQSIALLRLHIANFFMLLVAFFWLLIVAKLIVLH